MNFLRIKKGNLKKDFLSLSNQSRKYSEQTNLILDNIKTEVIQASQELNRVHRPIIGVDRDKVITDLREKYMKSLTGYNSIKNSISVDSDDLSKFNANLKRILGKNKDFYLYGDRNFVD